MPNTFKQIIKLRPDNFTPLSRTPWAGKDIGRKMKDKILPSVVGTAIGESWEFSCDPSFPSKVHSGERLLDLIEKDPKAALGQDANDASACQILVKLLNADDSLSLQVHPADDDPHLKKGECGKPESWYIISADPGCGLYLGFNRAMSRDELRKVLLDGDKAKDVLNFVPVKAGDYFELEPSIPHAVGPGVLLLEPQRILFGQSGKTYRMWDWGRKYDAQGRLDMRDGKARELHIEESLRIVDPQTQVGDTLVNQTRRKPSVVNPVAGCEILSFPANPYYKMVVVKSSSNVTLEVDLHDSYAALNCLAGEVRFGDVSLSKGEAGFYPAKAARQILKMSAGSELAFTLPTGKKAIEFSADE